MIGSENEHVRVVIGGAVGNAMKWGKLHHIVVICLIFLRVAVLFGPGVANSEERETNHVHHTVVRRIPGLIRILV